MAQPISGATPYVVLDARYEKVRTGGQVVDCAVLIALGIDEAGRRRVLGVSVALSEAEVHWRAFLESLMARGLTGVKYIVSDDHAGLRAARRAVLPSVPWQRCQFHLQQNASKYVSRLDDREPVARTIRAIFTATDAVEANEKLKSAVKHWQSVHPTLARWAEQSLAEGFTVFGLPEPHRVRMRTTNGLERHTLEIKRRTRVACPLPNRESCLRVVSALLCEQDEDWASGTIYLTMKPENTPKQSSQINYLSTTPKPRTERNFAKLQNNCCFIDARFADAHSLRQLSCQSATTQGLMRQIVYSQLLAKITLNPFTYSVQSKSCTSCCTKINRNHWWVASSRRPCECGDWLC